ncbi:alpha-1,6-mannosyl-glycoprotein 2-beta-N-acetylglucosaminyltransferase-like isoform X2 [Planococcus citri]
MSDMKNTSIQQHLSINEIQRRVDEHNKLQIILNEDIFGPLRNDSLVIAIQVHDRLIYLRHTIISLAQVKGIENALLIFSHDYYDEEINSLVQSINFCKVMQIFYPYSIQTHPNEFPGDSKDDCPRNIDIKEAIKIKCTNALHPDQYGHYREAKFTQIKHHWWWKANRIFDGLKTTKEYTGLVVFIEEDHYIAQDFIHMLHRMEIARQSDCPECKIYALGSHSKNFDFASDSKKAETKQWSSSMENMAITFNRPIWQELKSCAKKFCTYDDYNWDWSLLAVSTTCLAKEITAMVLRAPRVFHIGECGIHQIHQENDCKITDVLERIQKLLMTSIEYLYPQDLNLAHIPNERYLGTLNGNGGWGDVRDHNLCLEMVKQS